jgi:tetratricopeptide (TPR) repeat protein
MTPDRPTLEADLALAQQNGDVAAQAQCLMALAQIAHEEKEYALSQALYAQARDASDRAQNKRGKADALKALAQSLINGDLSEQRIACAYFAEALALYEQLGDQAEQIALFIALGYAYWRLNDNEIRIPLYQKALALFEQIEDPTLQARVSIELGGSMYGHPDFAPLYEKALLMHQQAEYRRGAASDDKSVEA